MKTIKLEIKIPDKQYKKLEEIAARKHVPVSKLIGWHAKDLPSEIIGDQPSLEEILETGHEINM